MQYLEYITKEHIAVHTILLAVKVKRTAYTMITYFLIRLALITRFNDKAIPIKDTDYSYLIIVAEVV